MRKIKDKAVSELICLQLQLCPWLFLRHRQPLYSTAYEERTRSASL